MLEYRHVGVPSCWSTIMLEYHHVGVPPCWSTIVLEYRVCLNIKRVAETCLFKHKPFVWWGGGGGGADSLCYLFNYLYGSGANHYYFQK